VLVAQKKCVEFGSKPKWRNRQTRMIQGHVGFMLVGVQVSPSALDFEGLVGLENL
jgi:hypothetical protein